MFSKFFSSVDEETQRKLDQHIAQYIDIRSFMNNVPLVSKDWKKVVETQLENNPASFPSNKKLLLSLLSHVPAFAEDPLESITGTKELSGGMTNRTIYFESHLSPFVARRVGLGSDKFLNRQAEIENIKIVQNLGITADVIFNEKHGDQITKYLPNPISMSAKLLKNPLVDPEYMKQVAQVLKKLHSHTTQFVNEINVFNRNARMQTILDQQKYPLPENLKALQHKIKHITDIFANLTIKTVPCHNDTTPGNFISSNGEMKMIDFEYSGNNDPMWDLACFSMEAELNMEQDALFLAFYFGNNPDNDAYQRFTLYKCVVEYWTVLWAHVQIANKNVSDAKSLLEYAEKRLQNCINLLNSSATKEAEVYLQKLSTANANSFRFGT